MFRYELSPRDHRTAFLSIRPKARSISLENLNFVLGLPLIPAGRIQLHRTAENDYTDHMVVPYEFQRTSDAVELQISLRRHSANPSVPRRELRSVRIGMSNVTSTQSWPLTAKPNPQRFEYSADRDRSFVPEWASSGPKNRIGMTLVLWNI